MTDTQLALVSALSAAILTVIATRWVTGFEKKEAERAVNSRLSEATRDLGREIHRLRLEGQEERGSTSYLKFRGLWYEYTDLYGRLLAHAGGYADIAETLKEMQAAVDAILDTTRASLVDLSRHQVDRDAPRPATAAWRSESAHDLADLIDTLTMHPDERRRVVRLLGELEAS